MGPGRILASIWINFGKFSKKALAHPSPHPQGRLNVLNLEFVFVLSAEIIQVSDSIAWVRCVSGNIKVGDGGDARQKGGQVLFSRPTLVVVVSSSATIDFWHTK